MAVAPAGRPPHQRFAAWGIVSALLALIVVAPLVALPASFVGGEDLFDPIARTILPEALANSIFIGVGVGVGALLVGGGLALLVTFWDFPGRRWLEWALVLPMALPSYVLVFVVLGQYGRSSPFQSNLFGDGLQIDAIRTRGGAVLILTAVLYPYVYVLGRSAFLGQSRQSLEAARSLGRTHGQAVRQVAVRQARPALAAGVALVVMEALADFGTVDLLGVQALTSGIYRVWNGAGDKEAALQLASVLVGLAITMLTIERVFRGRARYHQTLSRGDAVVPVTLRGAPRWLATGAGTVLLAMVFAIPVAQLVAWSIEAISDGTYGSELWTAARNTVVLGLITATVAVVTSTVMVYGQRAHPSRLGHHLSRLATVGYAVPGTVVAVAVYGPLVAFDRWLSDVGDQQGWDVGLFFTGSILGLVVAYLVRFHALGFFAIEARMGGINPNLDDAARSLGADRARVLADVHLPLLGPGMLTAALLVLVDVMKELPATALLRPLGGDTLAITVWESTKDSRLDAAALPALLIVAVGLLPVIVLVRLLRREGWEGAADRL